MTEFWTVPAYTPINLHNLLELIHIIDSSWKNIDFLYKGGVCGVCFVWVTNYRCSCDIRPLSIKWEDGLNSEVDRVFDVRQAPSLKGGGFGMRYSCRICNKEVYLFDDEGKWFVEKK